MNCTTCGNRKELAERWDAYYCPSCNEWLEATCDDPECGFCRNRPENPIEVKANDPEQGCQGLQHKQRMANLVPLHNRIGLVADGTAPPC